MALPIRPGMRLVLDGNLVSDFHHQIAGHKNEKILRYKNNCILKPQIKADLFQREVCFYETIFSDNVKHALQISFLARYHGVVTIAADCDENGNEELTGVQHYLMLDDITSSYRRPCAMDIKIGRQTFEPSACEKKREKEIEKYPHQSQIGFRISGLKVWSDVKESYDFQSKAFGRSITPQQVTDALACFFFNGKYLRVDVITGLIIRLENLLSFMKSQREYNFFSSSILIVYDAQTTLASTAIDHDVCRCVMIDFAHVVPGNGKVDEDYVFGIENLIAHLRAILNGASSKDSQYFISKVQELFL